MSKRDSSYSSSSCTLPHIHNQESWTRSRKGGGDSVEELEGLPGRPVGGAEAELEAGEVDDEEEEAGALDVLQEPVPHPHVPPRPLHQPRQVRHRYLPNPVVFSAFFQQQKRACLAQIMILKCSDLRLDRRN